MPGRIEFSTTPSGSKDPVRRLTIDSTGSLHNDVWSIAADGTATGITVTRASVVTDEQQGTVETLLDIITDLRARVAALEAG